MGADNRRSTGFLYEFLRYLLMASSFLLTLLFVASILAFFSDGFSLSLSWNGFSLTVYGIDIVLIVGLLVLNLTIYCVYDKVIAPRGENVIDLVLSFIGMVMMITISILLFVDRTFAWKYLILTLYVTAIAFRNWRLRKDMTGTALEDQCVR